jgi:hypothetical protein
MLKKLNCFQYEIFKKVKIVGYNFVQEFCHKDNYVFSKSAYCANIDHLIPIRAYFT